MPEAGPYAERPYERRLSESGRRIVNFDIDAELLQQIDRMRASNGQRRGLAIDEILRRGLSQGALRP